MQAMPYDSPVSLVFWRQRPWRNSSEVTTNHQREWQMQVVKKVKASRTHYGALSWSWSRCTGSQPQVTISHPPGGTSAIYNGRWQLTIDS